MHSQIKAPRANPPLLWEALLQCSWLKATCLRRTCVDTSIYLEGQPVSWLGSTNCQETERVEVLSSVIWPYAALDKSTLISVCWLTTSWREATILQGSLSLLQVNQQFLWWGLMLSCLLNLPVTLLWTFWDFPRNNYI